MAEDLSESLRSGRSLRHRATGPVAALTVYLPPNLATATRVLVAQQGGTLSGLVTRLLEEHLASEAAR
jgi:hypothetical protein